MIYTKADQRYVKPTDVKENKKMKEPLPRDDPRFVQYSERFSKVVKIIKSEFKDADEWLRENRFQRGQMNAVGQSELKKCGMWDFIEKVNRHHKSTGCNIGLLFVLWHYIETNTPQYFLECGTGVSTHLIAEAMKRFCYDKYNGDIKLISMEDKKEWYDEALRHPIKHDFVDIVLSPVRTKTEAMFVSEGYKDIPDYPYDTMFVDGPFQGVHTNLDVLEVAHRREKDLVAIIDMRIQTVLALFLLYGTKYLHMLGKTFLFGPVNKHTMKRYHRECLTHEVFQERIAQLILPHVYSGIQ